MISAQFSGGAGRCAGLGWARTAPPKGVMAGASPVGGCARRAEQRASEAACGAGGHGLRQRIARTAPKGDGTAPPKGDGAGAGAFASSDIERALSGRRCRESRLSPMSRSSDAGDPLEGDAAGGAPAPRPASPPPWRTSRAGNLKQSEVSWGVRRERKEKG